MTRSNEAAQNSQAIADHALAVYDGHCRIGCIVERDGDFFTHDVDDLHVGVFATLRDAMRAFPAERPPS
jgi:hypothetical protein